ncbi:MAG: phosphocholine cytidylyltransferase family protein [Lachnospiraceae bacterium]|nr:phosphocholine cytidylyltransferase family protein [Lachnospiraceae bacterium]
MKVIILAAGQGTRLRPLTDNCPKCMVKVNGKSIIERQLDTMRSCGIKEEDITIVAGYCSNILVEHLKNTEIQIIINREYKTTNMVYSLMCTKEMLQKMEDVLVSYGDIIYGKPVLQKILDSCEEMSVVVDDGWHAYWSERCENPLDDAETLMYDGNDYLTEIGQKTADINKVQSQYIGLMRFTGQGLETVLDTCMKAEKRARCGEKLWCTDRDYRGMYMTDLLQGMIDEGYKLKAVHIHRGWYEVDDLNDLKLVEEKDKGLEKS